MCTMNSGDSLANSDKHMIRDVDPLLPKVFDEYVERWSRFDIHYAWHSHGDIKFREVGVALNISEVSSRRSN